MERLWHRIEELEARLAEQTVPAPESELSDEVLAAISADVEQDAPLEEAAADTRLSEERLGAGQGASRRQRRNAGNDGGADCYGDVMPGCSSVVSLRIRAIRALPCDHLATRRRTKASHTGIVAPCRQSY